MRIGFDAKRYFQNRTGLGSYSRTLINALVNQHPEHEYFLYTPHKPGKHITDNLDISKLNIRYSKKSIGSYWRTRGILKDLKNDGIQIYHGLSNELPFGIHQSDIKSIVTVHDLLYKQFHCDFPLTDRMVYTWKTKYACKVADTIVAISETTKNSITENYPDVTNKIEVIHQGIDPLFLSDENPKISDDFRKIALRASKYILFIGNASVRKNLKTLLLAMSHCVADLNLVLVLEESELDRNHLDIIASNNLSNRIHLFNNISTDEMKYLYSNSLCLVYPSQGEGWGLPIEEAIACNTHVVVPDIAPFNENESILKHYYKEPNNHQALAKTINNLLNNEALTTVNQSERTYSIDDITKIYTNIA